MNEEFVPDQLLSVEKEQSRKLISLSYDPPVEYVYNPIDYAWETHQYFVRKYCRTKKPVLFLGMNPGPFGMAQNGVPFGEIHYVKNWLKIEGNVGKPSREHPQRIIHGLECKRSEVSGKRLWSLFEELCGFPEVFFKNCFVQNYCPLSYMTKTGKNVTPVSLRGEVKKLVHKICDEALLEVIKILDPKFIIGIGNYAKQRAIMVLKSKNIDIPVASITHPSPANPAANRGWKELVLEELKVLSVMPFLTDRAESFPEFRSTDSSL